MQRIAHVVPAGAAELTGSAGDRLLDHHPVALRYLSNFAILGVPLTVVIPVVAEPTLILKPGFDHGFVAEARRQSWIRHVVGLDVGTSVAAIEAYDSKAEETAAMAAALKSADVNAVVPEEKLLARCQEIAHGIVEAAPPIARKL